MAVSLFVTAAIVATPRDAAHATSSGTASVLIDEISVGGPDGRAGGFFELRNHGDRPVDLTGWAVFRCSVAGLRAKPTSPEIDLTGTVLAPGERLLAAHMGWRGPTAGETFTQSLPAEGFGLVVVDPTGAVADGVAQYPNTPAPTQSECARTPNLPATLAIGLSESWQRTDDGWVRAKATPDAANATAPDTGPPSALRIDEVAAAGPAGHGDDFVELRNTGSAPLSLEGWRLYRCTARGMLDAGTLQHEFRAGDRLAPGARLVVGGPDFSGEARVRTATSLADLVSGVLLVSPEGLRGDGISVSSRGDTACQTGDDKLPAVLDHRSGESWQRQQDGSFAVALRTPGARNAPGRALVDERFAYPSSPAVALSEVSTDPGIDGVARRNYAELGNYGRASVDISGWRLVACGTDGFRRFDDLAVVPDGTRLAPDDTWLAALDGTPDAASADARYATPLALTGAGVWVEDREGRRVDSVGIYHRNEMDESVDRVSPCTKGLPLPTFGTDRLRGETYQRAGFTGDDSVDFVPAVATPGRIDERAPVELASLAAHALAGARAAADTVGATTLAAAHAAAPASGVPARVLAAFSGSSGAPLVSRSLDGETDLDPAAPALSRDDGYGFPYVRLRIALPAGASAVGWAGRTIGRSAVRLSAWDRDAAAWRALDEAAGARTAHSGTADETVSLTGRLTASQISDGTADLLVQVVERRNAPAADAAAIADPSDYDVAISHLTDTQYYSEAYPEVYAGEVAWIAANAAPRKIAFATHTGDLIQNWVDPDQTEPRARREFAVASAMQRVLDDAGVANSVLPGNHDNKRGVSNDLFNEFFPPSRYADAPWYGGSIAPGDNSASWSEFTAGGARFVMLSLPYAYGEREIAWAEGVVEAHPDANVVISTHEHVTPKLRDAVATRSTSSRWVSHADRLWERVIAPHRNVVTVLSGHFHGLGAIVTEDAGGLEGHTVLEALADYQEFRTHTGERATGFQRLLQIDLGAGSLAVDAFSVALDATSSHPYDYEQFVPDNGLETTPSNERPWRILEDGLQQRYTAADDAFAVPLALQYAKAVETDGVWTDDGRGPAFDRIGIRSKASPRVQ
ncbi:lamin tail domain-containing protein [Microbacterium ulmi]|uniref:LTD domain-containing protein n=1 Tax=Microbacterium ulmi TaxID=179095 RepID=A0A7Y2Q0G8_9MICO|nr:lamin tail domain-containing protein [Microbacterium ulmi]NII71304.1 hypothetical protein [Microbacterium ulmi]NNH02608.1 hypothetical protein [Microbacterium ulmi]